MHWVKQVKWDYLWQESIIRSSVWMRFQPNLPLLFCWALKLWSSATMNVSRSLGLSHLNPSHSDINFSPEPCRVDLSAVFTGMSVCLQLVTRSLHDELQSFWNLWNKSCCCPCKHTHVCASVKSQIIRAPALIKLTADNYPRLFGFIISSAQKNQQYTLVCQWKTSRFVLLSIPVSVNVWHSVWKANK